MPVPDGEPAVVIRRQFQIFSSFAFRSCGGRGGISFAIPQGGLAVRRQTVPFDICDAVFGHILQRFAVAPDEPGACPGLAVRSRVDGIIDGYEAQHGAPVIAEEIPHTKMSFRRGKADQTKVPAPDKGGAIKKAGHSPAVRCDGLDPSIAAKERNHIHDEAFRRGGGNGIYHIGTGKKQRRYEQQKDAKIILMAMKEPLHTETSR